MKDGENRRHVSPPHASRTVAAGVVNTSAVSTFADRYTTPPHATAPGCEVVVPPACSFPSYRKPAPAACGSWKSKYLNPTKSPAKTLPAPSAPRSELVAKITPIPLQSPANGPQPAAAAEARLRPHQLDWKSDRSSVAGGTRIPVARCKRQISPQEQRPPGLATTNRKTERPGERFLPIFLI